MIAVQATPLHAPQQQDGIPRRVRQSHIITSLLVFKMAPNNMDLMCVLLFLSIPALLVPVRTKTCLESRCCNKEDLTTFYLFCRYDYVPDAVALHFRKSYLAAVSQLDRNVGVVLDELDAQGRSITNCKSKYDVAPSGFEMCFAIASQRQRCQMVPDPNGPNQRCRTPTVPTVPTKTRLESRFCNPDSVIQKFKPHFMHDRLFPGLASSTVVAFVGDHGWQLGDLGEFGKKTNFERATRASKSNPGLNRALYVLYGRGKHIDMG